MLEELADATHSYSQPLLKLASVQLLTVRIHSFICFCFFLFPPSFSLSSPPSFSLSSPPSAHLLYTSFIWPPFPSSHRQRNSLRVQAQSVASTISKAENAFEDNLELAKSAKQVRIILEKWSFFSTSCFSFWSVALISCTHMYTYVRTYASFQLITELQHDTNLQQKLEIDDKEPIRYVFTSVVSPSHVTII